MHFPILARGERADLVFALDQDGERRRLHAADGGQIKATFLGIERRHGARAVDADQPIRLRAALCRIGERQQLLVGTQGGKALTNRLRRHRLQPQPLDRLLVLRVLHDVAEDEFAFTPRVAGVDERRHIFTFHEPQQQVQPLLAPFERRQAEARRDDRQVLERPFAALDVKLLGHHELEQVADRGRKHVLVAFEVVALAREAAERARDVGGDRRLLCDDEFLGHGRRKAADDKCKAAGGSTARGFNSHASACYARARAREGTLVRQPRLRSAEKVLGEKLARRRLLIP